MTRPRLLDLFCGAGGSAMGYHRAGFEVIGVDIAEQPRYPFEFHRADALRWPLAGYDAIHASPPCQAYSRATRHLSAHKAHPMLLEVSRDLLRGSGRPWVLENVMGAPFPYSVILCGSQFGLPIRRHRHFQTSFGLLASPCQHRRGDPVVIVLDGGRRRSGLRGDGAVDNRGTASEQRIAMGIDWMTRHELSQAIPPAYTEWIGGQLLSQAGALLETAG